MGIHMDGLGRQGLGNDSVLSEMHSSMFCFCSSLERKECQKDRIQSAKYFFKNISI